MSDSTRDQLPKGDPLQKREMYARTVPQQATHKNSKSERDILKTGRSDASLSTRLAGGIGTFSTFITTTANAVSPSKRQKAKEAGKQDATAATADRRSTHSPTPGSEMTAESLMTTPKQRQTQLPQNTTEEEDEYEEDIRVDEDHSRKALNFEDTSSMFSRQSRRFDMYEGKDEDEILKSLQILIEEASEAVDRLTAKGIGSGRTPVNVTEETIINAKNIATFVTRGEWCSPDDVVKIVSSEMMQFTDILQNLQARVVGMESGIANRLDQFEKKLNDTPNKPVITQNIQPANQPQNSYATGPLIKPAKHTKKADKPAPVNPLSPHHHTRLVIQVLPNGIPYDKRPDDDKLVSDINHKLTTHSDSKHMRVVSVKWNPHGNCILFTRADQTADELKKYADRFEDLIGQGQETDVRVDQKWFKIQVNDIKTGAFNNTYGGAPAIYTPEQIHQELSNNSPYYAGMDFAQKPRWMRREGDLLLTARSSVVFAVTNEQDANHLIRKIKYLAAFGRNVSVQKYADRSPVIQCAKCYRYDHTANKCENNTHCRICDGNHTAEEHQTNCEVCKATIEELTASMEVDGSPVSPPPCTHGQNCAHCEDGQDRNHPSDHRRCPERIRRYGTARANDKLPHKTKAGATESAWTTARPKGNRKAKKPSQNSTPAFLTQNRFGGLADSVHSPSVASLRDSLREQGITNITDEQIAEKLAAVAAKVASS